MNRVENHQVGLDFHLLHSPHGGAIYILYYAGCCYSLSSGQWFSVPALPARHPTGSQVTPVLECLDGERPHIGSQDLSLRLQNASRVRQSRLVECGKG